MLRAEAIFWRSVEFFLAVILGIMTVLVFGNVVLRYGFHSSIGSAIEVSRLMLVWLIMIGAALTLRRDEHLAVDEFIAEFAPRLHKVMSFLIGLFIVFVCILLLIGTWRLTASNWQNISQLTGIPKAVGYMSGAISAGLMILIAAVKSFHMLKNWNRK